MLELYRAGGESGYGGESEHVFTLGMAGGMLNETTRVWHIKNG